MRIGSLSVSVLLFAFACGPTNEGGADSGSTPDAGSPADAGQSPDAGETPDAGDEPDAGPVIRAPRRR